MPDTGWIDPNVDLEGHMREIKYPAVRSLVSLLDTAGMDCIFFDGPTEDDLKGPGVYFFNDVHVMVRDSDLGTLRNTLEADGFKLVRDNPQTGESTDDADDATKDLLARTLWGGLISYSKKTGRHPDLWVNHETSWRHGGLDFVDLTSWFDDPACTQKIRVMGDTDIRTLAPDEILVRLADGVGREASRNPKRVKRQEIDVLLSASRKPDVDWAKIVSLVRSYDAESRARWEVIKTVLGDPAGCIEEVAPPLTKDTIHRFILTHVYHGLGALEDYYPGSVPQSALDNLAQDAEKRVVWIEPRGDWEGRYRTAAAPAFICAATFSIREQMEDYGNLEPMDFLDRGILEVSCKTDDVNAMPIFRQMTAQELQTVFAPLG